MVAAPANKARVASWLIAVDNEVNDPVRRESRDRDLIRLENSKDLRLIGLKGATTRLSCEYSGLRRDIELMSDEEDPRCTK